MSFQYLTNCVNSKGPEITDMVDRSRQITWETFIKHVPVSEVEKVFGFYSYRREKTDKETGEAKAPLHIKDDYAVSFHKSVFRGLPCYYICHSAIEYVFTER